MGKQAEPCKRPEWLVLALILTAFSSGAALKAEPLTLSGGLNNRFSDNVTLDPTNEIRDIESRINLILAHQTDPGRCTARTAADVGYGVWYESTYDPEDYASVDFAGACELARGLSWEVSDNLRDVAQDLQAGDTPDNRARKNVFLTGPVYTLMLGELDQLTFSAKYQNTEFSESGNTDSERYIGTASWNHTFSQTLSGGLQVSTNRAELDTGAEIDTDTASVLFSKSWQASRLLGSIGASQVESRFGGNVRTSEGVVGDVFLERDINPVTQIYIHGSRELTDQTSDFDIRFGEFVFNLQEITVVEVTAIDAGLARQFSDGAQLKVGVFANRSDDIAIDGVDGADGVDQVEDSVGLTITYSRPVSELVTFQSGARYRYRTFDQQVNDETYSADVGLNYQLSQDLSINGRIGHVARDSELNANEYRENWVSLGLSYQFF